MIEKADDYLEANYDLAFKHLSEQYEKDSAELKTSYWRDKDDTKRRRLEVLDYQKVEPREDEPMEVEEEESEEESENEESD